jgi:hypothetical protein
LNDVELVAVPPGVVIAIGPELAKKYGTLKVSSVFDATENEHERPFSVTFVAPMKELPVTVTVLPRAPLAGANVSIRGTTLKVEPDVAVPPAATTVNAPVSASVGITAVISVVVDE